MISKMDHFTIVTDRLEATRGFYVDLLGLSEGPRPAFPVPGYWLYAAEQPVLHIIGVEVMPEPRRGAIDHIAFSARGLKKALAALEERGIGYRIVRAPAPWRTWQVFFDDPNGIEVELDFEAGESAPEDWKARSGRQ